MSERELLTTAQVAEMCGVTTRTVIRWIEAGYFPGAWKRPGGTGRYRIPRDEIEAFVTRMTVGARQQGPPPEEREIAPVAARRTLPTPTAETVRHFEEPWPRARLTLVVEGDPITGAVFEFTLEGAGFNPLVVRSGN